LEDVGDIQEEIQKMASHKNMASLVLEKAMVMEEYIGSLVMNRNVHNKLFVSNGAGGISSRPGCLFK
jgi:hypothetical protein